MVDALIERINALGWTVASISQDDNKQFWVELREGFTTSFTRVVIKGPCTSVIEALGHALKEVDHGP